MHRTRTGKETKEKMKKYQEYWGPRTKPSFFVKKDRQCSCVETVRFPKK